MATRNTDPKRIFWNAYQRTKTDTIDRKLKLACDYLKIPIGDGILRSVDLWSEAVLEEIMDTKDRVSDEIADDTQLDGMLGDAYKILETAGYVNPAEVTIDDFKRETQQDISDKIAEEQPELDPMDRVSDEGMKESGTKGLN